MRLSKQAVIGAVAALLVVIWNLQQAVVGPSVPAASSVSTSAVAIPALVVGGEDEAEKARRLLLGAVEMEDSGKADGRTVVGQDVNAIPTGDGGTAVQPTSSWVPKANQYAGNLFGSTYAAPIASASDEWCQIELMPSAEGRVYRYEPTCVEEPLRQGSFAVIGDMLQFQRMPLTDPSSYLLVTDAEREQYWVDNTDPYIAHCRACVDSLVHKTLYRARRWWRVRGWRKRASATLPLVAQPGSFLGIHRTHFSTRRGSISTSGFTLDPFNETFDAAIAFHDIRWILMCTQDDRSYVEFVYENGGQLLMQFHNPLHSVRCLWRTLQLLFNATLAQRVRNLPPSCSFASALQAASPASANTKPMPYDRAFRFLPCYRNDISNMSRVIEATGMLGVRKNFWPFQCSLQRSAEGCGKRGEIQRLSAGVPQSIKVAVALSGFARSFATAKSFIYDNLVKPHQATLFGATWNIVGRAKKTVVINKKMAVRPAVMFSTLAPFFGAQANDTIRRLEVHDYFRYFKMHEVVKANGFLHPGLYFTLVRSLALVYDSALPFDVVIRTRFDIFAAVPFFFTRMRSATSDKDFEYALDLGSSCQMDGMWWPQFARFGEGKVLKHYADTRMKYFSWQVCDWMDVGTFHTMRTFLGIFDWMVEGNGHSAAQFLDHAFFLDHNISYQPLQLFLKLTRHKTQFFG